MEVPALRGVNLDVLPGEAVAVMGPSGCGKSSLLYVIGGLAKASRGKVLVDGNDLVAMSDGERTKLRRHEPTGNLDSKNSEVVLQMLRQLNKDLGQTVVMITHNPEATTYFDRVVHMRDGVIVDGIPAD